MSQQSIVCIAIVYNSRPNTYALQPTLALYVRRCIDTCYFLTGVSCVKDNVVRGRAAPSGLIPRDQAIYRRTVLAVAIRLCLQSSGCDRLVIIDVCCYPMPRHLSAVVYFLQSTRCYHRPRNLRADVCVMQPISTIHVCDIRVAISCLQPAVLHDACNCFSQYTCCRLHCLWLTAFGDKRFDRLRVHTTRRCCAAYTTYLTTLYARSLVSTVS